MFSNRLIFKLKSDSLLFNTSLFSEKIKLKKFFKTSFYLSTNFLANDNGNRKVPMTLKSMSQPMSTHQKLLTNVGTPILLAELKKVDSEVKDTIEKRQLRLEEEELTAARASQPPSKLTSSLPSPLAPYIELMRLDKPGPILLVYWPGAWAILGAASYTHSALPDFYLLSLFLIGATFTRASGCIINDIWDREMDKTVERTRNRPLASGRVGLPGASLLLAGNLAICLGVALQLNLPTQILGACALFPIALYPTAKRFTNWPQFILGTTFGWGAIMGWSAVMLSGSLAQTENILSFVPALILYAGVVNWITFYDTIYGYQDIRYDREAGIKSTSIYLEKNLKRWLLGFSSLSVSNLAVFGWLTNQEPIFYISLGLASLHFLKQIFFLNPKSPQSAYKQFKSNNTIGAIVAFGLLASILIK